MVGAHGGGKTGLWDGPLGDRAVSRQGPWDPVIRRGCQAAYTRCLALFQCRSGDHKGRAVLTRNPLGRLPPTGPGGTGGGIPVLGCDLLGLGLPGEDLLGGEAEFLNELQNGLDGLFGLGLPGVGDLFVEEFLLGEEFGVAGHANVLGECWGVVCRPWEGLLCIGNTLRQDGGPDGQCEGAPTIQAHN